MAQSFLEAFSFLLYEKRKRNNNRIKENSCDNSVCAFEDVEREEEFREGGKECSKEERVEIIKR